MEEKPDLYSATQTFLNSTPYERKMIFEGIGSRTGLPPVSIEKDWWVTLVLRAIYSLPYNEHICFKGGTSLSKCWNIIKRFSEDIDLTIDRNFLGFSGELSKNQVSDKLRRAAKLFLKETFKPHLEEIIRHVIPNGINISVSDNDNGIPTQDPLQIFIDYNTVYTRDNYVRPRVALEISGRSNNIALGKGYISSFVESNIQLDSPLYLPPLSLTAVRPERTLIEKICLLHEEFNKTKGDIRTQRMSRHLYDINMLYNRGVQNNILNNEHLFISTIAHRFIFNRIDGVDYNTEAPGMFNIIPPDSVYNAYKADYAEMSEKMIFGKPKPTFEELIQNISCLNNQLNVMIWEHRPEFIPGKQPRLSPDIVFVDTKQTAVLKSLGVNDAQIDSLARTGRLEIHEHNSRPAHSWDGDIPKERSTLRFSFHDGTVFAVTPDGRTEIPLRQAIRDAETLGALSVKPDAASNNITAAQKKGLKR